MITRLNNPGTSGLFFLIVISQFSYFVPFGAYISIGISLVLFLIYFYKRKGIVGSMDLPLLMPFVFMAFLSALLLLFGSLGEFERRTIFEFNLLQIAAVILTIRIIGDVSDGRPIFYVFLITILLELLILAGQFSFLSFGVGFSKIADADFAAGVITGSHGNPNNSATQLGLLGFSASAFLVMQGEKRKAYILLLLILPGILLTLSRTMLLFWFLNFACIFLSQTVKNKYALSTKGVMGSITLIGSGLAILFFLANFDGVDSDVLGRVIQRIDSFNSIDGDSSVNFRVISHARLFENIANLGVGSFSDLNYYEFFENGDPWLMSVNPHSYLVEYSFLFGYAGFFLISYIFFFFIFQLLFRSHLPLSFKILASLGLLFIQAVPSSLLTLFYFFIPFIFLYKIQKKV